MSKAKLKFIDNDPEKGLEYDWQLIRKEFNKLKIPKDVYNPCSCPFEKCKYFVGFSERSIGKTTNWLLLGMVMNQLYGTEIQYIRQDVKDIAPKSSANMFDVILQYDYVRKITNDRWNTVVYKSRRWYFANADENGEITERCNIHFCFMTDIINATQLKSSYNAPYGDFILFDEFINLCYYPNEFVRFADLVKTIIRSRQSPIIIMQANTINKESEYFSELGIYEEVQLLGKGDNVIVTSPKGTNIYVEWIALSKASKKKQYHNSLFFGFANKKLASITGEDWAVGTYPHIPESNTDNFKEIFYNIYIQHNNRYLRLTAGYHNDIGNIIIVTKATRVYDDSIILTLDTQIEDPRYVYGDGTKDMRYGKLFKRIWLYKMNNKMYYQNNDVGHFVENYLSLCK